MNLYFFDLFYLRLKSVVNLFVSELPFSYNMAMKVKFREKQTSEFLSLHKILFSYWNDKFIISMSLIKENLCKYYEKS